MTRAQEPEVLAIIDARLAAKLRERAVTPLPLGEDAFRVFYDTTAGPLRAYVARVLGNVTLADDIVQESYLRIMRNPPQSDDPQGLRAFLFRTASNLIVDHWRRRKRDTETPSQEKAGSCPPANMPLKLDMQRVFERLRPQERLIMWLAHVEGFNHREIALATGVGERSVRVMLHRTRKKLAKLIREGKA